MSYWLMKSEPDEFSIDDLKTNVIEGWDGIRNYQARNFMKEMKVGDLAFFYHSSCKEIGIVGTMEIVSTYYSDKTAQDDTNAYFDPKALENNPWCAIDVKFEQKFTKTLSLAEIKKMAITDQRLADLVLIKKGNRLSIMPITDDQWRCILEKAAP